MKMWPLEKISVGIEQCIIASPVNCGRKGWVCLEKESVLLQWGTLGGLLGVNPPLPTGSSSEPKRQQM